MRSETRAAEDSSLQAFCEEMTERKADWQVHAFGHTGHAFSNPAANMPDAGLAYNEKAARRSWQALLNFLEELF
jgi:dienelactone hydrolase